jgi:hypothetical protein
MDMLLLTLAFASFNPNNVIEARKKEFLNNVKDLVIIAESDSITLSYYWKRGLNKYRINFEKIGETPYSLIFDSENLWMVINKKKRKEIVSFLEHANLWIYDYLLFLPKDFKWKKAEGDLVILEHNHEDAKISMWINSEGIINKVKIYSEFRNMEIEYKDYMNIKDFKGYPKKWIVRNNGKEKEFEVRIKKVNTDFCTPCTFRIPPY